jgi:hypothetical protein
MGHEDTDIPAASLCLIDPRPSLESSQCIHFDVYGAMALAASGTISDVVAAARKETVVVFFHGGGFAAGNKNQYVDTTSQMHRRDRAFADIARSCAALQQQQTAR